MLKNALRFISTSLKTLHALPSSGVCSSRFNIFSRQSGCVRQASWAVYRTNSIVSQRTDENPFAINGFGRIGKCVLRLALKNGMNVVAINEPGANIEDIRNSLKFDTVHGHFSKTVIIRNKNTLEIDGQIVKVFHESEPENIKWGELPVDYVIESTGKFTEVEKAKRHMATGVKKVIISAPSKSAPMFVSGVNLYMYTKDMTVVSNASCTTNCAAPLLNIINNHFGVEHCLLTTVHAMTSSQPVLDGVKHRSAAGNMVNSTTGAAKAVGIVIPELKGKVNGDSIRVPVLDVSLLKLYISVKTPVSEEVLKCPELWESRITTAVNQKLVSSDFTGCLESALVDLRQVSVIGDNFVTIGAWYDNEMGYAARLLDLYNYMVNVDTKYSARATKSNKVNFLEKSTTLLSV